MAHLIFSGGMDLSNIKKRLKKDNITQTDNYGQTPLHVLCIEPEPKIDVIEYLLSQGANPKAKDSNGWTALLCVCSVSINIKLVELLLKNGADPKETNTDGNSALHYFARHSPGKDVANCTRALNLLIEAGAYINYQNRNGETPLHTCIFRGGNYDMFCLLLKSKADYHIINKHGESILHYAVRSKQHKIVQFLLETANMDPTTKTGVNGTPIQVAETTGDRSILDLLKKKEAELSDAPTIQETPETTPVSGSSITIEEADALQLKMVKKRRTWHIDYNELDLGERIGKGAFGAVYKADWRGTTVAMKKIHSNQMSKKDITTFYKEIQTISKLRHPNIILFLGACMAEPNICFITEFATRGDLFTVLHDPANQNGKLSWKLKLKMAVDSAKGLLYLHMCSPPVVHRDLKSLNLLVDDSYNIKLTDFGISKSLENNMETINSKMGTLNWLAPEVLDCRPYSAASDVYSFGIILWEILTQKTPFAGMHNFQILSSVARGQGLDVPEGCDPDYEKVMKDSWVVEPTERPSMKEVLDRLKTAELKEIASVAATPSATLDNSSGPITIPDPAKLPPDSTENGKKTTKKKAEGSENGKKKAEGSENGKKKKSAEIEAKPELNGKKPKKKTGSVTASTKGSVTPSSDASGVPTKTKKKKGGTLRKKKKKEESKEETEGKDDKAAKKGKKKKTKTG